MPKELYQSLAIYLLFALGLKGGVELGHATFHQIAGPILAALALGCLTPLTAYFVLRKLGKFSIANAAGIAAHYGSVSAVTFIAAQQFVSAAGSPAEGFMPTLLTILESPGIHIALAIGAIKLSKEKATHVASVVAEGRDSKSVIENTTAEESHQHNWKSTLRGVLTARTMILLVGGLVMGLLMGERGWEPVKPFFETGFKGALCLFLLEMGLVAGERIGDLKKVGPFLIGFGFILMGYLK